MEEPNMTLVAAVLVVGLLVGAGVGYYMAPACSDPSHDPSVNSYDDMDDYEPTPSVLAPSTDWIDWIPYIISVFLGGWLWLTNERIGRMSR